MGGIAGHLAHLYDNRNLTYNKMAEILHAAATGELVGTEKTDGYNIYLGYVDGLPRAARNKGDMSRGGMAMQDLMNRTFQGGEKAKKAYVQAFQAYENAINSLTNEERINIFGPTGEIFYNAEIQGPVAPNVVNYDENIINIHHMGHKKYNKDTNALENIDATQQSAFLDSSIDRFEEMAADEAFSVRRTALLTLNRITDENLVDNILNRIQETGYSGNMTINEYLENKLWPNINENFPEFEEATKQQLINRILEKEDAEGNKQYTGIAQISKGMGKEVKQKVSQFVTNSKLLIGEYIWPIEIAIHDLTVELLRGLKSAYILDNQKEVQRLKNETDAAIKAIYAYKGPAQEEAHAVLAKQLKKLKKHENIDTVVEGFAFQYDGQMYKFTGNFAPMNQLLGLFKYGRGKVPKLVKESILEQNEGHNRKRIIAIYPGRFQPMGRHHVEVFDRLQQEFGRDNTFISTSNKTNADLKDGIPRSPFDFHEKQSIASAYGIPAENVIMTKNPYNAIEILDNFDPEDTAVIYFVGHKDMNESPRFAQLGGQTKKGTPRYFKEYVEGETLDSWDKHGYVAVAPHISIAMTDRSEMSGTNLRLALKDADEVDFEEIMGFHDPEIYEMIKNKLSIEVKESTQHFLGIFRRLIEEILEEKKKKRAKVSKSGQKRVSQKIGILKDEGYPEKQAAAIAYSMEKEKKLEEEELEEISVMGAGAVQGYGRKKRKSEEDEVNEAINYLLQKLGV